MGCQLVTEAGAVLDLEDTDSGFVLQAVDITLPASREVVADRPMGHGTYDYTRWSGARAVTMHLSLVPGTLTRQAMLEKMAPYMRADSRPTLRIATEKGGAYRTLTLRPKGDLSAPWERPQFLTMTVGWTTVGSPMFLSTDRHTFGFAWSTSGLPGRRYDLRYPRVYPASPPVQYVAQNNGDQPADWVATIAGPLTNPAIHNLTTGYTVATTGLTVLAGQVLTINSYDHTVLLDGISSRYGSLDFSVTRWWQLQPGVNVVVLDGSGGAIGGGSGATQPDGTPAASACVMQWYDTFLF